MGLYRAICEPGTPGGGRRPSPEGQTQSLNVLGGDGSRGPVEWGWSWADSAGQPAQNVGVHVQAEEKKRVLRCSEDGRTCRGEL